MNKTTVLKTLQTEIQETLEMAQKSYAPYSHFRVGALLVAKDGRRYFGNNIENRSYSLTVCAERTAVFKAIQEGNTDWSYLIVASPDSKEILPPCGACRQVLTEFSSDLLVVMANKKGEFTQRPLNELYPMDSLHDLKSK